MKNRDLNPLDPLPANQVDALNEFVGGLATGFNLRIKPGDATKVEVPATPVDQVGLAIEGKWRYISATIERVGAGADRDVDVYATAGPDAFVPGSPGEIDNTDYAFALAVVDAGALPAGVTYKRKVGTGHWTGVAFDMLKQTLNPVGGPQIADGALVDGDIVVTRHASGGLLLSLAADSVGTAELAPNAVTNAEVAGGAAIAEAKLNLASDAVAGTASRRTLGQGAQQAAPGTLAQGTDQTFTIQKPNATDNALVAKKAASVFAEFLARADGRHEWGSGAAARDVFMDREGVNILRVLGMFDPGDALYFPAATANGTIFFIKTGELHVDAGGTNILVTNTWPILGLLLVASWRAADGANMAFYVVGIRMDFYGNTATILYSGSYQNGTNATFTPSAATGTAVRSLLMTPPPSIGNAKASTVFMGFGQFPQNVSME